MGKNYEIPSVNKKLLAMDDGETVEGIGSEDFGASGNEVAADDRATEGIKENTFRVQGSSTLQ